MGILLIVLRLVHIFSGVFWAGTSFFMLSFISPTVSATGQDGQKVMRHLMSKTRFLSVMASVALLTSVSGLLLYWLLSGFRIAWMLSGQGLVLSLGAVAGILAFFTGFFLQNRVGHQMNALAVEMQAAGGPPTPEQVAQMQALAAKAYQGAVITSILLAVALVGMSAAQYAVLL